MYRKKQKTQALLPADCPAQKDENPTKKALDLIKNERVFKYILLEKNKKNSASQYSLNLPDEQYYLEEIKPIS